MNRESSILFALLVGAFVQNANADMIMWTAELNSNNGKFTFDNQSDVGWSIKTITVDFSTALGSGTGTTRINWNGTGGLNAVNGFAGPGTSGSFNTKVTDLNLINYTNGNLSNTVGDTSTFVGSGQTMTFGFSQGTFGAGEGWGLVVDFDVSAVNNAAPSRQDISGTTINVTFWEGSMPALSGQYSASKAAGGSFPIFAQSTGNITAVPEPSSLLLLSALTICGVYYRRRQ